MPGRAERSHGVPLVSRLERIDIRRNTRYLVVAKRSGNCVTFVFVLPIGQGHAVSMQNVARDLSDFLVVNQEVGHCRAEFVAIRDVQENPIIARHEFGADGFETEGRQEGKR